MLKRLLLLGALLVVLLGGAALGAVPQERIYLVGPAQPLASGPGTFTMQVDGESFDHIWKVTIGVYVDPAPVLGDAFVVTGAMPLGVFAERNATCSVQQPGHGQDYTLITMQLPSTFPSMYTTATFTTRQAIMQVVFSYPASAFGHYTLEYDSAATQATTVTGIPPTQSTFALSCTAGSFDVADTSAPNPATMTWATQPFNTPDDLAVKMIATKATDTQHAVEYYFEETTGNPGGDDSGWQTSRSYTDTGVMPLTTYSYRVKARDTSPSQNETDWSTTEPITTPADTFPPQPNPITWQVVPQNLPDQVGATMAAQTAEDVGGVEYYFEETSGNPGGDDSGWQDSPTYTDTGLSPNTTYTYRAKARDKTPLQNETAWSTEEPVTTPPDTFPPMPNPPGWAAAPAADGFAITMTSQTVEDVGGVEYYFEEMSGNPGGDDSGWQDSPAYTDTGLKPGTTYTYRVKARDKMPVPNEGIFSEAASATAAAPNDAVPMLISYQGKLNQAGSALDGTVQIRFAFYTAAEGGTALYSEVQTVQAVKGIFNVLIGSVEPLNKEIFDEPVLYLGVKVADDAEMVPRKRVASTAFAIRAAAAGTADQAYWAQTSDSAEEALDRIAALQQQMQALQQQMQALEQRAQALEQQIQSMPGLQALLEGVTRDGSTITFSGVNLQIVNGAGSTETANGLGNLIVGYHESDSNVRTGSHNAVIGKNHSYSSYGGLVAGYHNKISAPYSCVSGGSQNTASGPSSSISGGSQNWVFGDNCSVSGGASNSVSGSSCSVSGGDWNEVGGTNCFIGGGSGNIAGGQSSSVSGGRENIASGSRCSIGGGHYNSATGDYSAVSGGSQNSASGLCSSVSGGSLNQPSGDCASVSGGSLNEPAGTCASVSGGNMNAPTGSVPR